MKDLLLSIEDGIATITINRPQQRNAITFDMWCQLPDMFSRIEATPDVRVVVVKGAGEEAFSAGGDISEFGERRNDPWQAKIYNGKVERALENLAKLGLPTIAVVKGFCVGGGCMLAAHCDIRIAADNAVFGMPVARLCTLIGYGEMQRFVSLIGVGGTLDLLLTARLIDAREALRIGLCNQVHPLAEIDQVVQQLASSMTSLAPLAQKWHKQMLQTVLQKPDLVDLDPEEVMLPDACFATKDYQEGIRAFLEKRPPRFQGK
jgi:enoyl-CoA hydratase/carnithine racemase